MILSKQVSQKPTFNSALNQHFNIDFYNCDSFASTIGSCSHNCIFMKENTNLYLIPRAYYLTGYQETLNQVNRLNVTYIDSSVSIYTNSNAPWNGPFYYYVSRNLKECFHDYKNYNNEFKDFEKYCIISLLKNKVIGSSNYYIESALSLLPNWSIKKHSIFKKIHSIYWSIPILPKAVYKINRLKQFFKARKNNN